MSNLARERIIGGAVLVGFLLLIGLALADDGFDESAGEAPRWLVVLMMSMFAAIGLFIMTTGTGLQHPAGLLMAAAILTAMLSLFHWGAFGPGVRVCTRTITLPFFTDSAAASNFECRAVLGVMAVMADSFVIGVVLITIALKYETRPWAAQLKQVATWLIAAPVLPLVLIALMAAAIGGDSSPVKRAAAWVRLRFRRGLKPNQE